ncbi:hypothetical protein THAOC_29135, partial [Thalassiosira oceanica]
SGGQGEAEVGQQEKRLRDGGGEDTRTVRHRPLVERVAGVRNHALPKTGEVDSEIQNSFRVS